MAIVYTETLIDDVTTDGDSPLNETLMQNIGQSINYLLDACFDGGANSEVLNIAATLAAATPSEMDVYESTWVSIGNGANNNFAHGLGRTPTVVLAWISDATGFSGNSAMLGFSGYSDSDVDTLAFIDTVDGTNVNIANSPANAYYYYVVAW